MLIAKGIVSLSIGFVKSYGALLGLRFLLGVFEAAILSGEPLAE